MLGRLGNALYWLCCIVAVFFIGFGAYLYSLELPRNPNRIEPLIIMGTPAVIAYVVGRGIRYVLAGR